MKRVAILVLAVVGVIYAASCPPCGPNEVYSECGTACPETCDNLGENIPCVLMCVPGCFCQPGYVRNNVTGACVKPCECPPKGAVTPCN
ncbi:AAEL000369-PA [Aedes aegypti]|uniref:AAEL000369-PA n=1 Tax=Aedes aegypti TaxID=7159 RepID=Q17PK7_AEDAE|nr:AAEL000369-PA [Aedes aegypti]